jgi:hypothetical protein
VTLAAVLVAIILGGIVLFQLALVLGASWGDHAYGGRAETTAGRLPTSYRLMSAVAIPILVLASVIVLARAEVVSWLPSDGWVRAATWIVFGYLALNTAANLGSRSRIERYVVGTATAMAALGALVVALDG